MLQAQLEVLRQGQENISSSCSFTEQALDHGSETEVLLVKKQMSERLSELASREFPEQPHENAQVDYVVETEGVRKSILNLGVLLTTSAIAHKTVATGEGLRHAVVGQAASLTITTKDKDGELVRNGSACLQAEIVAPDNCALEHEVQDNKNGTYELLYTPRQEGDHVLSICLYGQPIRGSPFRVKAVKASDVPPSPDDVKRRVKSPSSGHIRQKAVRRPSSMYSSGKKKENPIEDELIFRVGRCLAGREGKRATVAPGWCGGPLLASLGAPLLAGSRGREKGEFTNLQGISTSSSGRIVVADSNNQCVQVGTARLQAPGWLPGTPSQACFPLPTPTRSSPTRASSGCVSVYGDALLDSYSVQLGSRWILMVTSSSQTMTIVGSASSPLRANSR